MNLRDGAEGEKALNLIRLLTSISWALAICVVASCAGPKAFDTRLIGNWETDNTLGQLGESITRYAFAADGTFEVSVTLIQTKQILSAEGTYRTEGNTLILSGPNEETRSTYSFEDDLLIIDEGNDEIYRLRVKNEGAAD